MQDTKGKYCPIYKGKCPGNTEKCVFWQDLNMTQDGETQVVWACVAIWNLKVSTEIAKETRQAAASSDKVAAEVNAGASTILLKAMGMYPGAKQLEKSDENDSHPRLGNG